MFYENWLKSHDKTRGIAHYYIDKDVILRVIDTHDIAWHSGSPVGNGHYIGYEVCQSEGASQSVFLANEDMTLRQVAEDMLFYDIPVNRDTVRLHLEFSQTSCPARSLREHGNTINSVKDYWIAKIKHYQSLGKTVNEMLANEGKGVAAPTKVTKTNEEVAEEVLRGRYGNGKDRITKLKAEGYDPVKIQAIVDVIKKKATTKKSDEEVAKLVSLGRYGNGKDRITKLKAEGYDPVKIQAIVDANKKKK